jgi:outer membrane protein assembly factor BamA
LLFLVAISFLFSCKSITRSVPKGKYLVVKTKIVKENAPKVSLPKEKTFALPRTNKKLFGVYRFHLRLYNIGIKRELKGKSTGRIRRGFLNSGEPPAILDSNIVEKSTKRLSEYYYSEGFLNNKIDYEVKTRFLRKKRAKVIYHVNLGEYHTINEISYNINSAQQDKIIKNYIGKSYLKPGSRLKMDNISRERNRLTELLRNNGFFYFNNTFIDFQLDTHQISQKVDIAINIRNYRDFEPHTQQRNDNVVVKFETSDNKDTINSDYTYINLPSNINQSAISKNIFTDSGALYSADAIQKSYAALLSLGIFDFVTIRVSPSHKDSQNLIDVDILLKPAKQYDFTWQPQAIITEQSAGVALVSDRTYGVGNTFILRNKNIFGNGESFNIYTSTSIETQFKSDSLGSWGNIRQTLTSELLFRKLFFLENNNFIKKMDFSNRFTTINFSYLYEQNLNYSRHVLPLSLNYNFSKKDYIFSFIPLRISYNNANIDRNFINSLGQNERLFLRRLLTNNLIVGSTVSLFWTDRQRNPRNPWTIRSNLFETSGNIFEAYFRSFTSKTGIDKTVLGVQFSQFIRSDLDISKHHLLYGNNEIAYRFFGGFGLPYGNTEFLPFERRFFVGGANSLRAWRPRTLGPGSYSDQANNISIEKSGEILLQANFEYRFPLTSNKLNGALFFDAGNIWTFKEEVGFNNSHFELDRFAREIAFNTGLGVRYDFGFLIFRVDWGIPLHDPSKDIGNRWTISNASKWSWYFSETALNFAVGYPF